MIKSYNYKIFMLKIKSIKNKTFLGIFAHPDDDAFGLSGTLIKLNQNNNQIYEIFITSGDAGTNQLTGKKEKNLGEKREKEALAAGKIFNIKKIWFLRYKDGSLSNNLYHQVAEKIEKIIKQIKPDFLLTYEWRGVSGHIDHIFTSMVTSFLAQKYHLTVFYYARIKTNKKRPPYFIFFPPGYNKKDLDLIVDVSDVFDKKINAMKCHQTQIEDAKRIIEFYKDLPKEEGFFIKKF